MCIAKVLGETENQFWGDGTGWVMDPAGHVWRLGSGIEQTAKNARIAGPQFSKNSGTHAAPGKQTRVLDFEKCFCSGQVLGSQPDAGHTPVDLRLDFGKILLQFGSARRGVRQFR